MVINFNTMLTYIIFIFIVIGLPILFGPKNNDNNGTGLGGI
jgi:hypothetical protein